MPSTVQMASKQSDCFWAFIKNSFSLEAKSIYSRELLTADILDYTEAKQKAILWAGKMGPYKPKL